MITFFIVRTYSMRVGLADTVILAYSKENVDDKFQKNCL